MCAILAEGKARPTEWIAWIGRCLTLALALAACASQIGCDRNTATPYLIPTGIRPPILNPEGGVFGVLHYGPSQRADLASAPFPPTRVELLRSRDSLVVTQTSPPSSTNTFSFTGVQPGGYLVRAVVRGFSSPLIRVTVLDDPRDAGDLTLFCDHGRMFFLINFHQSVELSIQVGTAFGQFAICGRVFDRGRTRGIL